VVREVCLTERCDNEMNPPPHSNTRASGGWQITLVGGPVLETPAFDCDI